MNLELNTKKIWYFPQESKQDVPLYAIQYSKDKHYDKFIQLTVEDELITQITDGKIQVNIGGVEIDWVYKKKAKQVTKFQELWNRGVSFLKGDDVDADAEGDFDLEEEENDHVVGLKKHLKDQEDQFLETKDIKTRFISWNLRGDTLLYDKIPKNELINLLGGEDFHQTDLFFIGFQETIPLKATNLRSSQVPIENWINKIRSILSPEEYQVITTNKLLGLSSILIARADIALNFNQIQINSLGTGLLNLYGNKGAILTKVQINHQFELSFINCHFAAGENDQLLIKRRRELQGVGKYFNLNQKSNGVLATSDESILFDVDIEEDSLAKNIEIESDIDDSEYGIEESLEETKISSGETAETIQSIEPTDNTEITDIDELSGPSKIAKTTTNTDDDIEGDQNIIFIGGDLNYRLNASKEIINALIKEKDHKSLLEYDTLRLEKEQGRILKNFKEGQIDFPPTYKFIETKYDPDRKPSYTDRIFASDSKFLKVQSYESPEIYLSDHRPVITDYEIALPIINNVKRDEIVKKFFKKMDDRVNNSNRSNLIIEDLETTIKTPILTSSTIEIKVSNSTPSKISWEIIDSRDQVDKTTEHVRAVPNKIEPLQGVIPKKGEQIIKVHATLPIGCSRFSKTIVLRSLNNQDFFIIANFVAEKSYFGSTIDEMNISGKIGSGIPKQIYSLINYLTHHLSKDMFDENKLSYTHDLEKHIIQWIDSDQELELEELKKADDFFVGSSSRAVSRVLLLLLRHLDGGIVSSDLATYLLDGFSENGADNDIMENVLEKLPPLRANVLIYLTNFLRLCLEIGGIPKLEILNKFENLLIEVPKQRKRDLVFKRTVNYEKVRREFLSKLIG